MDAALIGACQKVEHYEIASYGTLFAMAKHLDMTEAADLLAETLAEEKGADEKLTAIAEQGGNQVATLEKQWFQGVAGSQGRLLCSGSAIDIPQCKS